MARTDEGCQKPGKISIFFQLRKRKWFSFSREWGIFQRRAGIPSRMVCSWLEWVQNRNFMEITTQLALFLDNRPGTLARVCEALSEAKINIYAITTSDTIDH